ncbi:MAG: STAS domain-containing protein [Anaerolineales bacterium]|nr:STAS domain-containing protein [Anaerolineales bacterium]
MTSGETPFLPRTAQLAGPAASWLWTQLRRTSAFLLRPWAILRAYDPADLWPDFVAGLTVTVIALPQALAYALISELPPETGLYAAIVGAVVGGLWGSSHQLATGPTNTTSLLILATLLVVAVPGTPHYVAAAALLAVMVGVLRLGMGLARLGVLVNFVSDSVIVGFTAGAGLLILVNQARNLLRLDIPSVPGLGETLGLIAAGLGTTHLASAALSAAVIVALVGLRRLNRRLPGPLIAMIGAAGAVWALGLDQQGVRVVGELPRQFPPFAVPPVLDLNLIGGLSTGALAIAAIGLVEALSITRSLAARTGQRLDSNQEFVGQGLANIACGLFSGYPVCGSFTRSAVNVEAGARSAVAGVFSGLLALAVVLLLAPLAAYIPLAALAGVVAVSAAGLIDWREMARIWRSHRGDRLIMLATLLATLLLPLQFAVLTGILMSLAFYLLQTSTPRVRTVLPDDRFLHLEHQPHKPGCPQLGLVEIQGDLYFGAAHHVDEFLRQDMDQHPEQRFLLLRLNGVQHLDISGIHALEGIVRLYRQRGGDVFLTRYREPVWAVMESSGFLEYLGRDRCLPADGDALSRLFYQVLDPAVCIYECPVRAFKECQNLPKQLLPVDVRLPTIPAEAPDQFVEPHQVWEARHGGAAPLIVDVRERREFVQGHIPEALCLPLPGLLAEAEPIPRDRPVVFVCRSGRRAARAAAHFRGRGFPQVRALRGGMLAWEAAHLLEAVDV